MALLNPDCLFQKYILTAEEEQQGTLLTYLQIACIKNQIALLAEEKVALTFSPENMQRDAELQGSINALKYLITLHEAVESDIKERASPSPENPSGPISSSLAKL